MFKLRSVFVLSLAVFATATPVMVKREPLTGDLVNLYVRNDTAAPPPPPAPPANGTDNKNPPAPPAPPAAPSNGTDSQNNDGKQDNNGDNQQDNNGDNQQDDNKDNNNDNNNNNNNNNTSLNDYGGLQSMKGFDDFYGQGNMDGSKNAQVVVIKEQQTVCQEQRIEIIQQKLVILQEMAKRIVTELVCEVETQTIVVEQLKSGLIAFQEDVQRKTVKQVGFDEKVSSLTKNILNDDGSLNLDDLNFKGSDVGNNTVVVSGDNWNDETSPDSVQKALDAAKNAHKATSSDEL
ncbi:hypothetical protein D9758_003685 [Tetrapyrgos nigripes]|uniref:Uncharacterized protein n=1 Tax=Tetrapyrgos nigripes TaxID=182062 RepID=A0A8H5GM51_9AGAR|nr:hypothetical protein D9758_003685 [Tetrapyrgos nigripes]